MSSRPDQLPPIDWIVGDEPPALSVSSTVQTPPRPPPQEAWSSRALLATASLGSPVGGADSIAAALRALGQRPRSLSGAGRQYLVLGTYASERPDLEVAVEDDRGLVGRPCLVRYLPLDGVTDPELRRARLLREAEVGLSFQHPNAVRVHAAGEEDGTPFRVVELVDGVCLRELVRRAGSDGLSLRAVVSIGCEVAEALTAAHRLRDDLGRPYHAVHGAISPDAIVVGRDGHPRITELTISRLGGRVLRPPLEARPGKRGYWAPEQVFGQRVDVQSDIFSLGIVLVELLAGRAPRGVDAAGLAMLPGQVRSLCASRAHAPAPLVDLIAHMTAIDPSERPQSMDLVATALRWVREEVGDWTRRRDDLALLLDAPSPLGSQSVPPAPMSIGDTTREHALDPLGFFDDRDETTQV